MKQKTSTYTRLALGCIFPICLCGFFVWLPTYLNDLRLSAFANSLYTYPLPPGTMVLDKHSELGKLANGVCCYYRAEQSMVSTLPRKEIKQYYEGVELAVVSFMPQMDNKVYKPPIGAPINLVFNESKSDVNASYFTLIILNTGFRDILDIRFK